MGIDVRKSRFVPYKSAGDGIVAMTSFLGAKDDHTLLMSPTSSFTHHPWTNEKMPYDIRDMVAIARMTNTIVGVAVPGTSDFKTFGDLVAYAKANPGKLTYASSGTGSTNHLAGELFNYLGKSNIVAVHYKGSGFYSTDYGKGGKKGAGLRLDTAEGISADLCLFAPDASWRVGADTLVSQGKNTPYLGYELQGRVSHTLVGGNIVFDRAVKNGRHSPHP